MGVSISIIGRLKHMGGGLGSYGVRSLTSFRSFVTVSAGNP
jgi:hypothetical protein